MSFETVKQALENNNMAVYTVKNAAEALDTLKALLPAGCSVSVGGSMTLSQCGVLELLGNGSYNYLDRYEAGLDAEGIRSVMLRALTADVYISSANAVTEHGEIFNVDGNANRVAPILYGPSSVILLVGKNKIVKDIHEAHIRVKTIAAPKNAQRLGCDTYCAKTGHCIATEKENCSISDGCNSDKRICADYVICARQRTKNRIKVILIDEELGF